MLCAAILAALAAVATAGGGSTCKVFKDIDIDPHTAGLGWAPGGSLQDCCNACSTPTWFAKGCRFFTFSKGRCWMKASIRSHPLPSTTPEMWPQDHFYV